MVTAREGRIYLSSCFGNAEESESQSKKTECSKEDVSAPRNGLEHVWCNKANDAVESVRRIVT